MTPPGHGSGPAADDGATGWGTRSFSSLPYFTGPYFTSGLPIGIARPPRSWPKPSNRM